MNFDHELVEHKPVITYNTDGGRFYEIESGERFPSVTTILGKVLDKSGLDEWRKAVGDEEATRITNRAARRGTALHEIAELYVMNNPNFNTHPFYGMPSTQMLWNQVKPVLDARLNKVIAVEIPLYSKYLRTAGRCDLVGVFDGKRSIIDYKTTNWAKDMDRLEGYFVQESIYAIMFEEVYDLPITQLVTISAGESENEAQVVIQHRDKWAPKAEAYIKQYYSNKYNQLGIRSSI
jgi:genome maintenance exonuclease 1